MKPLIFAERIAVLNELFDQKLNQIKLVYLKSFFVHFNGDSINVLYFFMKYPSLPSITTVLMFPITSLEIFFKFKNF